MTKIKDIRPGRLAYEEVMQGKIIKGIAGFYYVHTEKGIYECRAKGIFRKDRKKPLVGDNVSLEVLSEEEHVGNITEIEERKNELIRPLVANVDQMMLFFAVASPSPNLSLLDRFLVMMNKQNIPCVICFNKIDIASDDEIAGFAEIYKDSGVKLLFVSAKNLISLDTLKEQLTGKLTVLAGPSGVGKSSLINELCPDANMSIGEMSKKIDRGRHTTRHSEIFAAFDHTYLCDTPGFTSYFLEELDKEELKEYYPEFKPFQDRCKYRSCVHVNEPGCSIKEAALKGMINETRYKNYIRLYEEVCGQKKVSEKTGNKY